MTWLFRIVLGDGRFVEFSQNGNLSGDAYLIDLAEFALHLDKPSSVCGGPGWSECESISGYLKKLGYDFTKEFNDEIEFVPTPGAIH